MGTAAEKLDFTGEPGVIMNLLPLLMSQANLTKLTTNITFSTHKTCSGENSFEHENISESGSTG